MGTSQVEAVHEPVQSGIATIDRFTAAFVVARFHETHLQENNLEPDFLLELLVIAGTTVVILTHDNVMTDTMTGDAKSCVDNRLRD